MALFLLIMATKEEKKDGFMKFIANFAHDFKNRRNRKVIDQ